MKDDSQFILALFSTKYFANSALLRDEDPISAAKLMFDLLTGSGVKMQRLVVVFRQLSDTTCDWTYTFYDELLTFINSKELHDYSTTNSLRN